MAGVTDISDWTWNESGISYNWLHPTPETLTSMWNKSPISHIDSVKAPIFLMIGIKFFCIIVKFINQFINSFKLLNILDFKGKNDLRVPPSQGYEFYHSLKVNIKN